MAQRRLLTDEERQALFGIPLDPDGMARRFTLSRADQELVAARRRDANRIGFAVQLALLRYPGIALAQVDQPIEPHRRCRPTLNAGVFLEWWCERYLT
jgi:TnpA family transposase